jgi:uncharacterized membrane protein
MGADKAGLFHEQNGQNEYLKDLYMQKAQTSEWKRLWKELSRRMREPTGRVIFVIYFIAVVIILGGMGWIIPLCRLIFACDMSVAKELPNSFSTFFLAILASAMADIVLADEESGERSSSREPTKGFKVFALGLSLLGIPLAYAGIQSRQLIWAYIASLMGMVISLFLWWVLNADRTKWQETNLEPIEAAGGNTSADLKGSTEGLTV